MCECISQFENHITAAIADTQQICGSCRNFIVQKTEKLFKDNSLLLSFCTEPELSSRLDFCVLIDNDYLFCHFCFNTIQQEHPPKFSALNDVNVLFCQHYPDALQNLILTEKQLIARSHLIASILKLQLNSVSNSTAYNQLHDHVIVLSQDSGSLLDILLSAKIKLHEKIKII